MLALIGRNARYVLAIGVLLAAFLPGLSAWLRPAFPVLVGAVLVMAMLRLDLGGLARRAATPRRLAVLVGITLLLMPVSALALHGLARLFDLPEAWHDTLVILAAAPPIASSAGVCFLLGFNAALALEVAVFTTLATPLVGVAVINAFLATPPEISSLSMALRLGAIILGAAAVAQVLRRMIGAARITRNAHSLDGLTALVMLGFVIPVFDGVGALALADPVRALVALGVAVTMNLGANLVTNYTTRVFLLRTEAGTLGVLNGNRAVAIYLAIIPANPALALFVAFYQIPMYFTPLLVRLLSRSTPA